MLSFEINGICSWRCMKTELCGFYFEICIHLWLRLVAFGIWKDCRITGLKELNNSFNKQNCNYLWGKEQALKYEKIFLYLKRHQARETS